MNEILYLATQIRNDLEIHYPRMRKTLLKKLPLLIAVMLDARTSNTSELAATLPLPTPRQDMRNQWIARLLNNPLLNSNRVVEPFAKLLLARVAAEGTRTIKLTLDQENLGERFTLFLLSVSGAEKSFPLIWRVEVNPVRRALEIQLRLLEQIRQWLPSNVQLRLTIERPLPSAELFHWVQTHKWQYCFCLGGEIDALLKRNNEVVQIKVSDLVVPASGFISQAVSLFNGQINTNLLIWSNQDKLESRILAVDVPINSKKILAEIMPVPKIGVDSIFAGFRSRGASLHNTQIQYAIRLDHLILVMTIALYWCKQNAHNYCRILNRKYQM